MVKANTNNLVITAPTVLPDGNGGFTPCPDVLTQEEAIRYLRLDLDGPEKPANTLRYYRGKGLLKATRIGKHFRYTRKALDNFTDAVTEN